MAFWPFRRKRKESRSQKEIEDDLDLGISTHISGPIGTRLRHKLSKHFPGRGADLSKQLKKKVSNATIHFTGNKRSKSRSRQNSKPATRPESRSRTWSHPVPSVPLPKPGESASFPGLPRDLPSSIREQSLKENRTPLADLSREVIAPPQAPFQQSIHKASQTSLQPEDFTVTPLPTLRPKKSKTTSDISRAKSSKRKTADKQREEEIRAMSTPIPIPKRPRSSNFNSPLAQDSKQLRGGLNRHFERPQSQVSLPVAESLRSSISGAYEMSGSYRISAFASLSPRPTIRHSDNENRLSELPSRASTRKDKNPVIPEEPFSPRARIDELVEDMDTATLRKLMERDGRRKEQKKLSDTAKLERKLRLRLEKEKEKISAQQEAASGQEKYGDTEMEEGDRQASVADGHDPSSPQEESSQQAARRNAPPEPPHSPSSWLQDQSSESGKEDEDPSSSQIDLYSEGKQTPVVEMAQTAVRLGPRTKEEPVVETAQTAVRMNPRAFERPGRSALPPLVIERSYRPAGGVPQRTKSKFKEDLPDFRDSPVSPLSPYIDNPSKLGTMTDEEVVVTPLEDIHPVFRDEIVARAP